MIRLRFFAGWAIMLLFVWQSGYWKVLLAVFAMMSLHEGAHALCACLLGCPVSGFDIYPFGFCARMETMGYGSVYREMVILAVGPMMHLLYPAILQLLAAGGAISVSFCEYLGMMNRSILLFNLLPILPLQHFFMESRTLFPFLTGHGKDAAMGVQISGIKDHFRVLTLLDDVNGQTSLQQFTGSLFGEGQQIAVRVAALRKIIPGQLGVWHRVLVQRRLLGIR